MTESTTKTPRHKENGNEFFLVSLYLAGEENP